MPKKRVKVAGCITRVYRDHHKLWRWALTFGGACGDVGTARTRLDAWAAARNSRKNLLTSSYASQQSRVDGTHSHT